MSKNSGKGRRFRQIRLPVVAAIVQDKGGEGKSLLAQTAAEWARIMGMHCSVVEVDTTGTSLKILGDEVVNIAIDAKTVRHDPAAAMRALTPLYATIERACKARGLTVVEFGANEAARGALWAGMIDLQDEIKDLGAEVLVLMPFTRQAEAMRRGAKSAEAFLKVLPNAHLILVENERDGCVADLHPASDAIKVYNEVIAPLAAKATTIRMPMIEAGSWSPFEAAGIRLVDAVTMTVSKVMLLTGLPLPEAKIIRGDVAAWTGTMFTEFEKLISINEPDNG
jgi:hypothetical protein